MCMFVFLFAWLFVLSDVLWVFSRCVFVVVGCLVLLFWLLGLRVWWLVVWFYERILCFVLLFGLFGFVVWCWAGLVAFMVGLLACLAILVSVGFAVCAVCLVI